MSKRKPCSGECYKLPVCFCNDKKESFTLDDICKEVNRRDPYRLYIGEEHMNNVHEVIYSLIKEHGDTCVECSFKDFIDKGE